MKIEILSYATKLTAETGMAIHRKGEGTKSIMTEAYLPKSDSPDNWEDCEYGEDPAPETT